MVDSVPGHTWIMTTLSAVPHLIRMLARSHAQAVADHPRTAIAAAVGTVGAVGVVLYLRLRKKISPEEQERLRRKDLRIDLPVQVRYDARNPGNSIVAAEEWSGLQHGRAIATGISSHREEAS